MRLGSKIDKINKLRFHHPCPFLFCIKGNCGGKIKKLADAMWRTEIEVLLLYLFNVGSAFKYSLFIG
ncbi:hypothetical protein HanRHA438_Chr13g0609191 [Helianthus annuus]|uniref:Uncharacterized protein n=1 Tax=Helianthus annuus TaxID=4232 RepID=A0A9K3EIE6_HELAN|nr:hypothetical protein HanXRQr2_Chr13g0598571 [Helianthus annuus]KAJ0482197.1 hypothetical protein HanIR_Chr13g0651191 [Helianthus annuus]KAJ0850096.1 hypothetical protein HanPSC8_Chr13g0576631 [Helianthus annuus]KAJ0859154.1 hypothetical protein HanRHA438_Chr13g0609191 [Helianthus annuus]